MSEDMEQKFETWLRETDHSAGLRSVSFAAGAYFRSTRAAFMAGAESQQARIAELEAERDRLLDVAKTAWVNIGHAEWCGQLDRAGVACDCGMSDLRDLIFTPKEESRG